MSRKHVHDLFILVTARITDYFATTSLLPGIYRFKNPALIFAFIRIKAEKHERMVHHPFPRWRWHSRAAWPPCRDAPSPPRTWARTGLPGRGRWGGARGRGGCRRGCPGSSCGRGSSRSLEEGIFPYFSLNSHTMYVQYPQQRIKLTSYCFELSLNHPFSSHSLMPPEAPWSPERTSIFFHRCFLPWSYQVAIWAQRISHWNHHSLPLRSCRHVGED